MILISLYRGKDREGGLIDTTPVQHVVSQNSSHWNDSNGSRAQKKKTLPEIWKQVKPRSLDE